MERLSANLLKKGETMLTVSREVLEKDIRKYFSHIERTGEDVVVTENEIPFVRLTPVKSKSGVDEIFADVRGRVRYFDDVLKPETEEWGEI